MNFPCRNDAQEILALDGSLDQHARGVSLIQTRLETVLHDIELHPDGILVAALTSDTEAILPAIRRHHPRTRVLVFPHQGRGNPEAEQAIMSRMCKVSRDYGVKVASSRQEVPEKIREYARAKASGPKCRAGRSQSPKVSGPSRLPRALNCAKREPHVQWRWLERLGYNVSRKLPGGAFGEVHLVYHRPVHGWQVLKVLPPPLGRIEGEALQNYWGLQHPNLIAIRAVFDRRGCPLCYTMDAADDARLGREIRPEIYRPMTLAEFARTLAANEQSLNVARRLSTCLAIAKPLLEAMEYLHENNLCHCDIKLSNVVCVRGVWQLADISLLSPAGNRGYRGTTGYVPPEGHGHRTGDIFSMGKVVYELLTGLGPHDFPRFPQPELPQWKEIGQVLAQACHRDWKQRFSTAEQFGVALAALNA